MDGFVHSIESFGTVDGPGIRLVVFCQGCPMRCKYCHNPDTWQAGKGTRISVADVLAQYDRNKQFYARGGITVTGGEPLMQIDFVLALFEAAKARGIHTCIDTSGVTYHAGESEYNDKLDALLAVTDLVMLDIKHIDSAAHRELTGFANGGILAFAKLLEEKNVPVWIRHVVVPGLTDGEDDLRALGRFIGSLRNVKALDVLPYHTMGESKYEALGMTYPLAGVPALPKERAAQAREIILSGVRESRKAMK